MESQVTSIQVHQVLPRDELKRRFSGTRDDVARQDTESSGTGCASEPNAFWATGVKPLAASCALPRRPIVNA